MQRLRRLHSKTRSGCITCRARHVKCDEKQPVCKRCEGRSEVCTYDTPRANISGSTCVSSSDTLSTGSGANTGPMDMSCTTGEKIVTMSQHQRRKGGVKAKSGELASLNMTKGYAYSTVRLPPLQAPPSQMRRGKAILCSLSANQCAMHRVSFRAIRTSQGLDDSTRPQNTT